jgi:hypothetical protein
MTQLNLYDAFSSASSTGPTHTTVQDIDDVVGTLKDSGWVELKYSQPKVFHNVTITAKRSGCSVGGSYFVLNTSTPRSTMIYAPKYSHRTNISHETDLKIGHANVDCVITYPGGTGSGLGVGVSALKRQKKVRVDRRDKMDRIDRIDRIGRKGQSVTDSTTKLMQPSFRFSHRRSRRGWHSLVATRS